MRTAFQIDLPREQVEELCRRRHIQQLALFGSVLREDFRQDSDIDVLVTFAPESRPDVFELIEIENELEDLLGRKVDLVERQLVEQSPNYIRRKHILETAEVVHDSI